MVKSRDYVNLEKSGQLSTPRTPKPGTSLAELNPALATEWNFTRNGELTPHDVTKGSNMKVWWLCSKHKHEWKAIIISRSYGTGCPICMGKVVSVGFNDLGTLNPELASEWHPTKNRELSPSHVTVGSSKSVWWLCREHQHEWETPVRTRSRGTGCPVCAGQSVLVGFNDLAFLNPELTSEWHPTLNEDLTAKHVTTGSSKSIWWACKEHKHEWKAAINQRSSGTGCPVCAGKSVLIGFNDLVSSNPKLASEWHPTRNGELTPFKITTSSNKKVWWSCHDRQHEWEATVNGRDKGAGCPFCAGQKTLAGFNDLATLDPKLAAEWHPTLNGELRPCHVTVSSEKMIWWLCHEHKHQWKTLVNTRSSGKGCPFCAGQKTLAGFNDLATLRPHLAAEWHPTKNGELTPSKVTIGTNKNIWWSCGKCKREWQTKVRNRTNHGCSVCAAGVTERTFRERFAKLSTYIFNSTRIPLNRPSRKTGIAQIDMLNEHLKLAIEYDGAWTHGKNNPEKKLLSVKLREDQETTQALVDAGYCVVRIREHDQKERLPFVPLDDGYTDRVFQIIYRSHGDKKDNIDAVIGKILNEKSKWFQI